MPRGRPRQLGDRYPSGDLKRGHDLGTDELRAKRQALTGDEDDKRASYPLGILYARRLILQGDHYAGRRYAALFTIAVRPLTIASVLANLVSGADSPLAHLLLAEGADEDVGAQARSEFLAAHAVLAARGAHILRATENVAVYEHPPRTEKQLNDLRDGLDALHKHFEAEDARSKAARAA